MSSRGKKKNQAKGFRPETIRRIVKSLSEKVEGYTSDIKSGKTVAIVISTGNQKIGRCMNVSLAPIITCKNCKECKSFCYDVKACCQYENVRNARAKNTALFRYDRDLFFRLLWEKMSRKKSNKFLRFHVSGEIVDIDHFSRMVETAKRFPDFKIWTYTKVYWIVNQYIREHGGNKEAALPDNFKVMFSEWKGLPIDNPYDLPVFRCVMENEEQPTDCFKCPGCCDYCKAHGCGCVAGKSSYVHLH